VSEPVAPPSERTDSTAHLWREWIGGLAEAAIEFERRLDAGEPVAFPAPAPPTVAEAGPLPAELADVVRLLHEELTELQRRAEACVDVLARRLAGTAVPRPRAAYGRYDLGASVDVAG